MALLGPIATHEIIAKDPHITPHRAHWSATAGMEREDAQHSR